MAESTLMTDMLQAVQKDMQRQEDIAFLTPHAQTRIPRDNMGLDKLLCGIGLRRLDDEKKILDLQLRELMAEYGADPDNGFRIIINPDLLIFSTGWPERLPPYAWLSYLARFPKDVGAFIVDTNRIREMQVGGCRG